jgi:hypothetical protein
MGLVKYLIAILLLIPSLSFADANLSASSAGSADIQSILTTASAQTGVVTVTIPAETQTHTARITINMVSGFANVTSLIIQGASQTGTVLTNCGWTITTSPTKKFRLTNMTLNGVPVGENYTVGLINIIGPTAPATGGGFRLDHLVISIPTATLSKAVWIFDNAYGVIDSNTSTTYDMFASIRGNTGSTTYGGNVDWAANDHFGTENAVYIEGNTFYNALTRYAEHTSLGNNYFIADGDGGSKTVVRFNTAYNFHIGQHDATISNRRSNRSWEYYNNYIYNSTAWGLETLNLRGGTGYAYNNVTNASYSLNPYGHSSMIYLRNHRDATSTAGRSAPWLNACDTTAEKYCNTGTYPKLCTTDGDCGGGEGSCVYIDNQSGNGQGYPCRDQLGRGKDQALKPALFWNNKTILALNDDEEVAAVPVVAGTNIVNNRDYCYHSTTMPATCNDVATSYTPYTCPHPLADPSAQGECTAGTAGTTGYTLTGGGSDETAPTVTSVYVNGATMTINFSEPITSTDNAAFTLDPSGADVTVDCPAVSTAATSMACTISRALVQSETAKYAYTDTKVVDAASNALDNIGATDITGNLTPAESPTSKLTVNKTGSGCTVTSSPSGISVSGATASDDFDFNTGTVVTLSGWSENGWNAITYGGDCAANGTVTMNAAKECTATCTQVYLFP